MATNKIVKVEYYNKDTLPKFNLHPKNRLINPVQVNSIAKAWLSTTERIDELDVGLHTHNILDGQHRNAAYYLACEKGTPKQEIGIKYIDIAPEDEEQYIINKNNLPKHWTAKDYLRRQQELKHMIYEFCSNYPILWPSNKNGKKRKEPNVRYAYAILYGKNITKDLKTIKTFDADVNLKEAHERADECQKIFQALEYTKTGPHVEHLCLAWYKIKTDPLYSNALKQIGFDTFQSLIHDHGAPQDTSVEDYHNLFTRTLANALKLAA